MSIHCFYQIYSLDFQRRFCWEGEKKVSKKVQRTLTGWPWTLPFLSVSPHPAPAGGFSLRATFTGQQRRASCFRSPSSQHICRQFCHFSHHAGCNRRPAVAHDGAPGDKTQPVYGTVPQSSSRLFPPGFWVEIIHSNQNCQPRERIAVQFSN